MRLFQLTLSGFKSFARATAFEFPSAISAIVGPNGSGKSNVAEAIRWVLGEQSLKTIRGRKGEDLIFSGSPGASRMGKASVRLSFENRDRAIPVDFDEVILERKIFRDGLNEYYLNGSHVRLKDIVELIARMGLGEAKHNIIGQGEVDRLLMASPAERRWLLEEAIGLRIFQLKKREAERRLEETGRNIGQVEALAREIAPHLKFLKSQADKAEKRGAVQKELEKCLDAYITNEKLTIDAEVKRLESERTPIRERLTKLEAEIAETRQGIDRSGAEGKPAELLRKQEDELAKLEVRRRDIERELGRIEGRLEGQKPLRRESEGVRIDAKAAEQAIRPVIASLKESADINAIEELKSRIASAAMALERIAEEWRRLGRRKPEDLEKPAERLTEEKRRLSEELATLEEEIDRQRQAAAESIKKAENREEKLRAGFERIREREEEAGSIRLKMERLGFDDERLQERRRELEEMIRENAFAAKAGQPADSPLARLEAEELKKKIERLKARLEEIGGIDSEVLKEYAETKNRHDFLERELGDLKKAEGDLRRLIAELDERIERDFQKGFDKINEEFQHYFKIIFGGGKGELEYMKIKSPSRAGEDGEEGEENGEEAQPGIAISVDIPRKRIKGLDMLSGGERALSSVALLFAITAVNPPPFLVLDETDAALDEANSQKYAQILKELSRKTQLILITHNRETMQRAGVLYGVTMGDDGISKILSLKLEEAESYGNR